jgi:hypothetical protein
MEKSKTDKIEPDWVVMRCGHPALRVLGEDGLRAYMPCSICMVKRLEEIVGAARAVDEAWDSETGAVVAGKTLLALRNAIEHFEEDNDDV